MKRVVTVALAIFMCFGFMGCASKNDMVEDILSSLAELRQNAYRFESDAMQVDIITGRRENPYLPDGKAEEAVEFTVITFTPKNGGISDEYDYLLSFNGEEFSGALDPHPFGAQYIQDLGKEVSGKLVLTVKNQKGKELGCELEPLKTEGMISHRQAVESFVAECGSDIKRLYSGNKFAAEAYVRFLQDPLGGDAYYWYCAATNAKYTFAVLIDPLSAEVVQKRGA